jgi:hypothetical protein
MKPQILMDAENAWPEDETMPIIEMVKDCQEWNDTPEEINRRIMKDVNHMHRVFSFESDSVELINRFNVALRAGLKELNVDYTF